mmetsp:Transcript_51645/g.144311  ORF Transcript_51645/g.144311 Transcript_51645/m.144311 type:complete len:129 (-) Transcript_51645:228-614(-)
MARHERKMSPTKKATWVATGARPIDGASRNPAAGAAGTTATMGGGAVSVRTTVTAEGMMEMAAATTAGAGAPAKMMRMATPRRRGGAVVAGRWTRADLSRETADTAVSTIALTVDDPGGVIKGFDIHR